jgi:hypothetical protein
VERSHVLARPVTIYCQRADDPRLVAKLREWCGERLSPAEIATRLNAAGFVPPKRAERFTAGIVQRLRAKLGLFRRPAHGGDSALSANEYRPAGLARRLRIGRETIRGWGGCMSAGTRTGIG